VELHSIDSDGDHLPDYIEIEMGTDPENPDSDEDFLNDIEEVYLGTSPLKWDTDGDNFADGHEKGSRSGSTSPFSQDTDCDGLPDPWEDNDGDGLLNREEQLPIHDGLCYYTDPFHDPPEEHIATEPNNRDTDGDGWNDGEEIQVNSIYTGSNAVASPPPTDRLNSDLDISKTNSWAYSFLTSTNIEGGAWDAATFADWRNGLKLAGNYNIIPANCSMIAWYHFSPWYVYEQRGETNPFPTWKASFFTGVFADLDRGSPYDWNLYDCDPTLNDTDSDLMDDNWDPYPLRINLRNGTYAAINSFQPVGGSKVPATAPKDPNWNFFGRDVSIIELEKGDFVDINISVGFEKCSPNNVSHTNYVQGYYNPMQIVIRFRPVALGIDGQAHTGDDDINYTNVAHLTRTFSNVGSQYLIPGMDDVPFTNHLNINTNISFFYQTFRIRIPSRVPAGHVAISVETDCTDNFHFFPSDPFLVY